MDFVCKRTNYSLIALFIFVLRLFVTHITTHKNSKAHDSRTSTLSILYNLCNVVFLYNVIIDFQTTNEFFRRKPEQLNNANEREKDRNNL